MWVVLIVMVVLVEVVVVAVVVKVDASTNAKIVWESHCETRRKKWSPRLLFSVVLDLAQGFFPGFSPFPLSIKIDRLIRGTQALKSKQCYKLSSKKKISSFTLNTYSADNICIRFTLFLLFGSTHTGIRTRCAEPQKWFHNNNNNNNNNNNETSDHRVTLRPRIHESGQNFERTNFLPV